MSSTLNNLRDTFDESGHRLSPLLKEETKNFLIDIDGTICDDIPNEEPDRMVTVEPYPDARDYINKWFEEGHIITFFTSRTEDLREITIRWLDQHKFKYHGLLMGKPRGGNYHWIDNHAVKFTKYEGKFTPFVKATMDVDVFEK